jgi:6-phospho-beta-glucosidase
MEGLKIAIIGGGSSYTPELAEGIIKKRDTFPVRELALYDVESGREKAETICALIGRMFRRANVNINVSLTFDRKQVLGNADFVVCQFRVGGLRARSLDEKLPLKYGLIGQETTGPGGFAKALRTIPVILELCRDMQEICPDAWLINFTNPSGLVTQAILTHTNIKCIGLCNVPVNMERDVKNALGKDGENAHCVFAGINHLSFIGRVFVDGRDILKGPDSVWKLRGEGMKNIPDVQLPAELLDRLGFIPSSYLKYYFLEKQMIDEQFRRFMDTGKTRADDVMEIERELFKKYAEESLCEKPAELSKRGGSLYSEAAVSLMDSIYGDRGDIQVLNVQNGGCLPELHAESVIETNCVVRREGATPLSYGPLPPVIRGLVQHAKAYEKLVIEAAVEKSRTLALSALIANPLVHDAGAAINLFNDILDANRIYIELE